MITRVDPFPYFVHRLNAVTLESDAPDLEAATGEFKAWLIRHRFWWESLVIDRLAPSVFRCRVERLPDIG